MTVIGWIVCWGVLAPSEPLAKIGVVRTAVGGPSPAVYLQAQGDADRLEGQLLGELRRLASAKVEVIGYREGPKIRVERYRILEVARGVKPLVGELKKRGTADFALSDGDGSSLPLQFASRALARLQGKAGAKVWVYGRSLPTGTLKVLRFGILREPGPSFRDDAPPVRTPAERTETEEVRAGPERRQSP